MGREKDPEVDIQVNVRFVDMLSILICAGDEEGMGGSSDEGQIALECGDGGQDVRGSTDSAAQKVLLPDMPEFGSDDNDSEEEDRVQFEKRQAGKFGVTVWV